MNRVRVRAPRLNGRMPVRATRVFNEVGPIECAPVRPAWWVWGSLAVAVVPVGLLVWGVTL